MGVCSSGRRISDDTEISPEPKKGETGKTAGTQTTSGETPSGVLVRKVSKTTDTSPDMTMHTVDFTPSQFNRLATEESEGYYPSRLSIQGPEMMRPSRSADENVVDTEMSFRRSVTDFTTRNRGGSRKSMYGRRGTVSARIFQTVSTRFNEEDLLDAAGDQECVENMEDIMESRKILTRVQSKWELKRAPTKRGSASRSARMSIITADMKRLLQDGLDSPPGTRLEDVVEIQPKDVAHPEAINYWREFEHIRFYKSPTVTNVIHKILETKIPEIGITYQTIIDEFLNQDWPINIFLHGGLMRDIMTSTIGNDVDIAFTCPHREMKKICDENNWPSTIREDIPYWVIGGETNFETKLEGFPLSFGGLAKFHIADFACNTIYYDCKNNILIDRYGRGVESALEKKLTLPIFEDTPQWREKWRDNDFIPGVKIYRFFKFVARGFGYDKDQAKFIQDSLITYVQEDPQLAEGACFHALRKLARGQDSRRAANKFKEKLSKYVKDLFIDIGENVTQEDANKYWKENWEHVVNKVIQQGEFKQDPNDIWENSNLDLGFGDLEESNYDNYCAVGTGVGGGEMTPKSTSGLGRGFSNSGFE